MALDDEALGEDKLRAYLEKRLLFDGDTFKGYLEKRLEPVDEYSLGEIVSEIVKFELVSNRIFIEQVMGKADADRMSVQHQLGVRLEQLYEELSKREQEYLKR